jgi:hypothetical protein
MKPIALASSHVCIQHEAMMAAREILVVYWLAVRLLQDLAMVFATLHVTYLNVDLII